MKNKSSPIKHIYKEAESLFDSYCQQWFVESAIDSASDWHGEYGDTRSPLLQTG